MATTPDWQSLARKLRRGKPLEQACEEAGIALDQAEEWLKKQRELAAYDDDALRLAASNALRHGLDRLIKASRDPLRVGTSFEIDDEGNKTQVQYALTDVDAAKALVKFALDARKVLVGKAVAKKLVEQPGQPDLFDGGGVSNWIFRDDA